MTTSQWTEDILEQARHQGDEVADRLAEKVMSHEDAIHRFNHFLEVADALVTAPELMLVDGSELKTHFHHLYQDDPEVARYYEPMETPEWVDEDRLERASSLWKENTLAVIGVLYAASLPSCYLIEKGVPALYRTEKLSEHKYIYQRIYETGLMLDRVMEDGGIRVVPDYKPNRLQLVVEILNELDPEGGWEMRGLKVRRHGRGEPMSAELARRVETELKKRQVQRKYLWGKGYVTAKKVRFLHASIRFMLLHPERVHPHVDDPDEARTLTEALTRLDRPWDTKKLDIPVNQEDMAFVLLTFGYLIPLGLERWGCRLNREKKEAFLHLWRVIGTIMGIREDLMTDDWEEARDLHDRILYRQGRPSDQGKILAGAVMAFMQDYLPHYLGVRKRIPAQLIVSQLGAEKARMVLPEESFRIAQKPIPRLAFNAGVVLLRVYYASRNVLLKTPLLGGFVLRKLHESADHIIASWRDSFIRRPFEISADGLWLRPHGVSTEFQQDLAQWRRKLFNVYALALALLVGSAACLIPTGFWLVDLSWRKAGLWALATLALALLSAAVMQWVLPRVFEARPRLGVAAR